MFRFALTLAVALFASVVATPAQAEGTTPTATPAPATVSAGGKVFSRVDFFPGQPGSFTTGILLFDSGLEVWTFGNGSDVELGKLWDVYHSKHVKVLAGGYVAYWPDTNQYFILPWLQGEVNSGRTQFKGSVSDYLPLNGGPNILYSNELALTYRPVKGIRLGVATAFWNQEGYQTTNRVGPKVEIDFGERDRLEVRHLLGRDGNNNTRVQWTHRF